MSNHVFYLAVNSQALIAAGEALKAKGYGVVNRPCEAVTDLLLPVPSMHSDDTIKGGVSLSEILKKLPASTSVFGGNLPQIPNRKTYDLLKDETYLASNASITAYCAIRQAMIQLPVTLRNCPILVIGWGRIGKCLCALLWALEADVTVAARKEEDRAIANALGYRTTNIEDMDADINRYRILFNTVPAQVLDENSLVHCRDNCLKIDLASSPGIIGADVIWARGLPGKDAPESSGKLIAKTITRLLNS